MTDCHDRASSKESHPHPPKVWKLSGLYQGNTSSNLHRHYIMSTIASKATNKPTTKADASSEPSLTMTAVFYMVLLAVQFGIQPILTRRYAPWGVTRSTIVLMQEAVKFVIALFFLQKSGNLQTALKGSSPTVFCLWPLSVDMVLF